MIGFSRWQVPFQALSFPLSPSGSENCTWEAQNITTFRRMISFSPRNEQPHSRDVERQAAPTVTMTSSQGDSQHPLNVPLALRQCPVSEGKAHMLPPHQPKLSPSVACHTGVNLWVTALPITKHPRHGTANKDRVGWTGQREGLDSYHRTVGICEKERKKGRLWKERTWGWLKISLTYFTTLPELTALRPGTGALGCWESIRSLGACRK